MKLASGLQIERLHFSDHATSDTGARVCRQVLSRLTREGLLRRAARRVGGIRAGSASYVYMLAPAGRRLVGEELTRQVREPSMTFLDHTLAIGDVHLALRQGATARAYELVMVELEPVCWRRYVGSGGAGETLRPDMLVVTARGHYEYSWFLEVDLGTEYTPTLVRKCRAYESYWRTGKEQQRNGIFPIVTWVVPSDQRRQAVEKAINSTRSLKQELFRVVTTSELISLVAGGAA